MQPIGWFISGKPYCWEHGNELSLACPPPASSTAIWADAAAAPLACTKCQVPLPGQGRQPYDPVADARVPVPALHGPLPPPPDLVAKRDLDFDAVCFLEELHDAHRRPSGRHLGKRVKLIDLYGQLSRQRRERYSLVRFTQEVQLLASEPATTTRDGIGFALLPGAPGMRPTDLLEYVTAEGDKYVWFGIEFEAQT